MKQIITTIAVLAAAITLSSCASSVADFTTDQQAAIAVTTKVQVKASLAGTRAGSSSAIKETWNNQDWIYVNAAGKDTYFKADENSADATFTLSGSSADWKDGVAYAAYPKSVRLIDGEASFSFAGQTGLLEDIDRYDLMTSKSTVSNGSATFSFKNEASVISLSNKVLYEGAKFAQVVLSGEGFSSDVTLSTANGRLEVTPNGNKELVVNNPSVKDGNIYIALFAGSGKINLDVYGTDGSHFFASMDAAQLSAGNITSADALNWDGGLEITFAPSVENWN